MNMRKIFIVLSMLILSGCLSPAVTEPESIYILSSSPAYVPTKKSHSITVMVLQPETNQAYNTTQMAYTVKSYQIGYYIHHRWVETPAQMLYPLIIQTLQNTHYFHAVVTPRFTGHYDYLLSTQILKLQQDFIRYPAMAELTIRLQLSKAATNQVIATKQFSIVQPITQSPPYGGVIAFNQATREMLKQMAEFCLLKIK